MNIVNSEKKTAAKKFKPKEELQRIEKRLKESFKKKKEIERSFSVKFREIERQREENQKWFDQECKKIEKLENLALLWWDFWRKELEKIRLREQIVVGTLPSEQKKIDEQIEILNAHSLKLEEGFGEGKIDVEIITKLRKEFEELFEEKEKK